MYPVEILICLSLTSNDVEHFIMFMGHRGISDISLYASIASIYEVTNYFDHYKTKENCLSFSY